MITKELIQRMEKEFSDREVEFDPSEITEFAALNFNGERVGTGYSVNRGYIEFSRGMLDSYVYIEFNDGETVSHRPDSDREFDLWTKHFASNE